MKIKNSKYKIKMLSTWLTGPTIGSHNIWTKTISQQSVFFFHLFAISLENLSKATSCLKLKKKKKNSKYFFEIRLIVTNIIYEKLSSFASQPTSNQLLIVLSCFFPQLVVLNSNNSILLLLYSLFYSPL